MCRAAHRASGGGRRSYGLGEATIEYEIHNQGKDCTTWGASGSPHCAELASAASLHIGCAVVSLRRNYVVAPSPNSL